MKETELKIYNEAKRLFYKDGYYKTTVRDITKAAGVNSGLFNYYFQNKYNLATKMYDDIFYNIKHLVTKYYYDEENPAIFMGIMMRLHLYVLYNEKIIKFSMDALKEGIFEESIHKTTAILVKNIDNYYNINSTDEELHLLLSITLGSENACLKNKYKGEINFSLKHISNIILKIHLNGFDLDNEEIKRCTDIVIKKFEFIEKDCPDFVDLII